MVNPEFEVEETLEQPLDVLVPIWMDRETLCGSVGEYQVDTD